MNPNCDCRPILHKYANEDVSLGAWFIGLEVEHIDDRSMCCGTPPGMASENSEKYRIYIYFKYYYKFIMYFDVFP